MRILVCGGRTYNNYKLVSKILYSLFPPAIEDDMSTWLPPPDTVLIHGGARGADLLADQWAVVNYVKIEEFQAAWDKYGKMAGRIRNGNMLKDGKPDIVVAFPGGRGTAHMVEIAKKAGIKVLEVTE